MGFLGILAPPPIGGPCLIQTLEGTTEIQTRDLAAVSPKLYYKSYPGPLEHESVSLCKNMPDATTKEANFKAKCDK